MQHVVQPRRHRARPRADRHARASSRPTGRLSRMPDSRLRRSPTTASRSRRPVVEPLRASSTLYRRRRPVAAARRRAAGLLGRLGARLVDLHVLQARPARDARGDALAARATTATRAARARAGRGRHRRASTRSKAARCMGRVHARQRTVDRNGTTQVTLQLPGRADARARRDLHHPTFRASVSDPRDLGAQVGFKFVPRRDSRARTRCRARAGRRGRAGRCARAPLSAARSGAGHGALLRQEERPELELAEAARAQVALDLGAV